MTKRVAKPKFRVGQVVQCPTDDFPEGPHYGRVSLVDERIMVEFWDSANGEVWNWGYDSNELRPLTARERGGK